MNLGFIGQPFGTRRLGDYLGDSLIDPKWTRFLAAVAFAKRSGTRHVVSGLHSFARRGFARVSVGVDHGGTSLEGVEDLWGALDGHGELYAVHHTRSSGDRINHTFHPKVLLFENRSEALALVGSGNLTQGGLFGNYEAGVAIELRRSNPAQWALRNSIVTALDEWADPMSPLCDRVDVPCLFRLYGAGLLPREVSIRPPALFAPDGSTSTGNASPTFLPAPIPPPPPSSPAAPVPARPVSAGLPTPSRPARSGGSASAPASASAVRTSLAENRALVIEVIPHRNGEVLLSRLAIRDDPGFFGYPFSGLTVPKRKGNPGYPMRVPDPVVDIVVYDGTDAPLRTATSHPLNTVDYARKGEIRITVPHPMHELIPDMSLLVMTAAASGTALDYALDFFPPGSPSHSTYASSLSASMPSGGRGGPGRRYGWA